MGIAPEPPAACAVLKAGCRTDAKKAAVPDSGRLKALIAGGLEELGRGDFVVRGLASLDESRG
jgi:hypothetical protein